jgi:arylsulfatase A-like enzyme
MNSPRNVLFIIADQFRADCLAYTGNPIIKTPNLDRLAASGVAFRNAFVQTAPCGPSRSCIFTSRYLCSTRSVDNMTPLVDADDNLAMCLRVAGYEPAISGYNDYAYDPRTLPEGHPYTQSLNYNNFLPGFDVRLEHEYDSPEYYEYLRAKGYPESYLNREQLYSHDVPVSGLGAHTLVHFPARYKADDSESQFQTSNAIDFIRERRGQGWILSLNYLKPHPPLICPAPYHEMYDPSRMPKANRRPEELHTNHPYWQIMHRNPRLQDDLHLREYRACYYGMISEIDACIGRLIDTLHETKEWNNTLIVFTSDHGEYLGDHWLTDKAHFYDETMRVPYIVRDPSPEANATRGKIFDAFVESIDTAPTILEFMGIPIPDRFMGRSVLGIVRNERNTAHRTEIHFEFDFRNRCDRAEVADMDQCILWVLRDEEFKYVQFAAGNMPSILYDLKHDPHEQHNVANIPEFAPKVCEYAQRMLRWRMKHEDQRMEHWASQYRR